MEEAMGDGCNPVDEDRRTLGIPPAKKWEKTDSKQDSSDESFQKLEWLELKKVVRQEVLRCDRGNVQEVVVEFFKRNVVRGRGILVRCVMKSQLRDSSKTSVFASLIAVLNSKIPEIGELALHRLVIQFRKFYVQNKRNCRSSALFLVHLMNQKVCNEIVILQIVQMLLENVSDDSVGLSVDIMRVGGQFLQQHSLAANNMIFERLRSILHESGNISKRTQNKLEQLLQIKRAGFARNPAVEQALDLVEEEDKETHFIELYDEVKANDELNIFRYDNKYDENERRYHDLKRLILGEDEDDNEEQEKEQEKGEDTSNDNAQLSQVKDMTQSELVEFQKLVYLTVMSSMSSDEAVHKLLKLTLSKSKQDKDNTNEVLLDMIVKCCSNEKTYSKYYGIIGEKMCARNKYWHNHYVKLFKNYYDSIHQYETNALRNIGKFFGHLFALDRLAIEDSWSEIRLTEEHTNPASRILLKFIFQEMIEEIGINEMKERLQDDVVKRAINRIFPVLDATWKDADNLRFSINFFTAIGLGVLTEEMRTVLNNLPPEPRGRSLSRSLAELRSASYSRSRSASYSRSRSQSRSPSGSNTKN